MQLKLNTFINFTVDIIYRKFCLFGINQTQVMRVQKNDESLRENVGLNLEERT